MGKSMTAGGSAVPAGYRQAKGVISPVQIFIDNSPHL
jgi:hypothetical protein